MQSEEGAAGRLDDDPSVLKRSENEARTHAEKVVRFRRKRKRPRTKAFRVHLKNEIERALCSRVSSLGEFAFSKDPGGRLSAPLNDVVAALGLDNDKYRSLSRSALSKLGDISTIFSIDASAEQLRIRFEQRQPDIASATVYTDNLPRQCDILSLYRRAVVFGTVVCLHPIFSSHIHLKQSPNDEPSPSTAKYSLMPIVEQHIQAAFIQFVDKESAEKFCEAYSKNWPVKHVCKRRKMRRAKRALGGAGGRLRNLRVQTLITHQNPLMADATISAESRKRKRAASEVLSDDESPLKRSRSSLNMEEGNSVSSSTKQGQAIIESHQQAVSNNNHQSVASKKTSIYRHRLSAENLPCRSNRKRQTFRALREKYFQLKRNSFKRLKAELRNENVSSGTGDKRSGRRLKKRGRSKLMLRVVAFRERYDNGVNICFNESGRMTEVDGTERLESVHAEGNLEEQL
ncbi:unnamed protein product [Anisakis simplex]|uniref:Uncharacterized protein n=1 Tax=Anisakis simplex TaxID=6269 RepID=A0A3P6RRG2_ANISI|nr:unnamed protein product [Anisakis simplex]